MPTTEVISDRVVHCSDMPSKDVNIITSGEKPDFPVDKDATRERCSYYHTAK